MMKKLTSLLLLISAILFGCEKNNTSKPISYSQISSSKKVNSNSFSVSSSEIINISYNFPDIISLYWNGPTPSSYNIALSVNGNNYNFSTQNAGFQFHYPISNGMTISAAISGSVSGNASTIVGQTTSNDDYESSIPNMNYSVFFEPANKLKVSLNWANYNNMPNKKIFFYLYYRSENGIYSNKAFGEAMLNDFSSSIEITSPYFNGTKNLVRLVISTRVLKDGYNNLRSIGGFPIDYTFYVPYNYYTNSFQISPPYYVNPL